MRPIRALAVALLFATPALAQDDFSGTYTLKGKEGFWGNPPKFTTTLTVSKTGENSYDIIRVVSYDGTSDVVGPLRGTGTIDRREDRSSRMRVEWKASTGAADVLANLGNENSTLALPRDVKGTYKFYRSGKVKGWVTNLKRNGELKDVKETGEAAVGDTPIVDENDLPIDPSFVLDGPSGVFLKGSELSYQVQPGDAAIEVLSGEASVSGNKVTLSKDGIARIQLQKDGKGSQVLTLEAVTPEVTSISVDKAIPLEDAPAPHWSRQLRSESDPAWQPAVILKNQKVTLSVTLKAPKDLSQPVEATLTGNGDGGQSFSQQLALQGLGSGQTVQVTSSKVVSDAINITELEIDWELTTSQGESELQTSELRLYTIHAKPVDNPMPRYAPSSRQGKPLLTKLHFELACYWAKGRTTNTGNDSNSICHRADNYLSHLVHGKRDRQVIPHYEEGAEAPINYKDLRGSVGSNGIRGVAGLYYPPLDADEAYERYHNYRNNFGWWVLENPKYVGGRCNQQAALICDVFGTLGIKAEVYYIERVARGPRTGRPMRRYYKSSRSDKSWNFHGQAKAYLDDGSEWLYDGSGSWPPNRINGQVEDLMKVPNGPYISYWNPWRYEDGSRQYVPASDIPSTWRGVPAMAGEEIPTPENPRAGTTGN